MENNNGGLGPQIFINRNFYRPTMIGVELYFVNTFRDDSGIIKVQEISGEYMYPPGKHKIKVSSNLNPDECSLKPLVSLTEGQAQRLMDDLWRAGIRPAEGRGTIATAQALENHLSDMRAIVEKKLDVKLKDNK